MSLSKNEKLKVENFVDIYLGRINDLVFEDLSLQESEKSIDLMTAIGLERKQIDFYLNEAGLTKLEEEHKETIKDSINNIYTSSNFDFDSINEFVDTVFYGEVTLTSKDIELYQNNLKEYRIDEKINGLYNNIFDKHSRKNNRNGIEEDEFKELLKNAFKELAVKDKAEIFANFNIFFEEYAKTKIGEKRLELIEDKYLEKKKTSKTIAINEWIGDIVNTINQNTPNSSDISFNADNKVKMNTASSGKFDGLYFINKVDLNNKQEEELSKVENFEDLNKFEKKIDSVSQIQISTTSDNGINIEGNSVLRHALANKIIATVLNNYWLNKASDQFIDNFTKKDSDFKENQNIRGAILEAFKSEFNIKEKDTPEEEFETLQKDLTANPVKFIASMTKINSNTLDKKMMEEFLKLEDSGLIQKREKIFYPKTYFSVYFKNGVANKRSYEESSDNKDFSELEKHDVLLLAQYSALSKKSNMVSDGEKSNVSDNAVDMYYDNNVEIRGYSGDILFNNEKLSSLKITDIDKYIVDNFIMSDNAVENSNFFDIPSRNNISFILKNIIEKDKVEELGIDKEDFFNKLAIIKSSTKAVFSEDLENTIEYAVSNNIIEKENKKLKEENIKNENISVYKSLFTEAFYKIKLDYKEKGSEIQEKTKEMILSFNKVGNFDIDKDEDLLSLLNNNNIEISNKNNIEIADASDLILGKEKKFTQSREVKQNKREINWKDTEFEDFNYPLSLDKPEDYKIEQRIRNRKSRDFRKKHKKESLADQELEDGGIKNNKKPKNR
jgi:hypothetical protein